MAANCLKSPPDIENLYDSSPMQISAKVVAKALKFPEKEPQLQEMQVLQKSIANLSTILNIIEIEMQNEQEYDFLEILAN